MIRNLILPISVAALLLCLTASPVMGLPLAVEPVCPEHEHQDWTPLAVALVSAVYGSLICINRWYVFQLESRIRTLEAQ